MAVLRAAWRLLALLGLLAVFLPLHLLARRRGISPVPQRFLSRAAQVLGLDVRMIGAPQLQDVFYVGNHVSWMDIFALGGATGCAFISKDGIDKTPVVGWLARQNNTVFVSREQRGAVHGQIAAVRQAVATHQPIALFPEGTTGDGVTLLPFKPALFAVLLPPPRAIRIQPVHFDYGKDRAFMGWVGGESGLANALRIVGAPGRRTLTLNFLPAFDPGDHPDRKILAARTRADLEAAQQASLGGAAPVWHAP
jgi:lyso-ornithine lipid O-acyltransferase